MLTLIGFYLIVKSPLNKGNVGEKSYWCESKCQNLVRHQLHQKALYMPLVECACVVDVF